MIQMKPETIKRRARKRKQSVLNRKAALNKRLSEMARIHGPNSIWAEMLRENSLKKCREYLGL